MEEVGVSLKQMMWFSMYKNQRICRKVIIANKQVQESFRVHDKHTKSYSVSVYSQWAIQKRKQEILFIIGSLNISPSVYFLYIYSYWLID